MKSFVWVLIAVSLAACTEIPPLPEGPWAGTVQKDDTADVPVEPVDTGGEQNDADDVLADLPDIVADAVDTNVEDVDVADDGVLLLDSDEASAPDTDDVPDVPAIADSEDVDDNVLADDGEESDPGSDSSEEEIEEVDLDTEETTPDEDIPVVEDPGTPEDVPEVPPEDVLEDIPDVEEDTGTPEADPGVSDPGPADPDVPVPPSCENVACEDDGNPCTNDVCESGACVHPPSDGVVCDDGDPCSHDDMCMESTCIPGEPPLCTDANPCTDDACNLVTGACVFTAKVCDDGNLCTANETCVNGGCTSGTPVSCDDEDPCTDDACDTQTGECFSTPNDIFCDDSNGCSKDTCIAGVGCVYDLIPACCTKAAQCDDHNVCTADACEADTKTCLNLPTSTPACSDENACTEGDFCKEGACTSGTLKTCTDANPCTDDACDLVTGACVFTANSASCNDEDACTLGDVCAKGSCASGTPMVCDDGNLCTANETCVNGGCTSGTPVSCDDEDPCTKDSCNPSVGCSNEPFTPDPWIQDWKKGTFEPWFQPDGSWSIGSCTGGPGCTSASVLGILFNTAGTKHTVTINNPAANPTYWPLKASFWMKGFYGFNTGTLTKVEIVQGGGAIWPAKLLDNPTLAFAVEVSFTPDQPVAITVTEGNYQNHNGSIDFSFFSAVELRYVCPSP